MKQTLKRICTAILGVALLLSMILFTASCKKKETPHVDPRPEDPTVEVEIGELKYQYSDGSYYDEVTQQYRPGNPYYTVIGMVLKNGEATDGEPDENNVIKAKEIVIPAIIDGTIVGAIADSAFYGNKNIITVEIPSTVNQIGERAFAECSSLVSIDVDSDSPFFKSVDGNLYSADGSVLVQYAIGKDESSFTVDSDVERIEAYAFAGADLTDISLGDKLAAIGNFAFSGTDIEKIVIPAGVDELSGNAFYGCDKLSNIDVDSGNQSFKSIGGHLYAMKNGETIFIRYASGKNDSSFTIGGGTTVVGSGAFSGTNSLETINLVSSVSIIEPYAFMNCSLLKTMKIPFSVTSIDASAFDGCTKLDSFTVDSNNTNYSANSGVLLSKDSQVLIKHPAAKTATTYTVPSNVTTIGDGAFADAVNLSTLKLTDAVTYIGVGAFDNCKNLRFNSTGGLNYIGTDKNSYYALVGVNEDAFDMSSFKVDSKTKLIAGGALANNKNLKKVDLADTAYICKDAFAYCTSLELIDLSGAVNIYSGAISHCSSLSKIIFGIKTKLIEENAITDCPSIKSIFHKSASKEAWETLKVDERKQDSISYGTAIRYYLSMTIPYDSGNYWRSGASIPAIYVKDTNVELEVSEGLKFSLDSTKQYYIVSSAGNFTGTDLVIPAERNGKPVKKINGGAFSGNNNILSVVVPDTVESIGSNAFANCPNLSSVYLLSSTTSIDSTAFDQCDKLTWLYVVTASELAPSEGLELTLSSDRSHYTVSGLGSFKGTNVVIPERYQNLAVVAIDGGAFVGSNIKSIFIPYSIHTIGANAFANCTSLNTVIIDNSVTSIGTGAFKGCTSLINIDMPDELATIESELFSGCTALQAPILPERLVSIGDSAFFGCTAMNDIVIPYGAISISDNAFYGCTKLKNVNLPETLIEIGNNAFASSGIEVIELPESVAWISASAFVDCSSLRQINIHEDNVDYQSINGVIYREIAGDPVSLIYCPEGYIYPKKSVNDKSADVELLIPDTVISIADNALANCIHLRHVSFGAGIETIGSYAFANTTAINIISLPASLKSIGDYAFSRSALVQLNIADGSTAIIGAGAFNECENLLTVTLSEGCQSIGMRAFYGCKKLMNITIPDSVTEVGILAFYNCEALKNATIGDGLTEISSSLFGGCISLEQVNIGKNVSEIAYNAFDDCYALEAFDVDYDNTSYVSINCVLHTVDEKTLVRYPMGMNKDEYQLIPTITKIADGAFNGATFKSVILNDALSVIGDRAFMNCRSLESVTIGENVASIGKQAFRGCTSLASLDFVDSAVALTVGDEAFYNSAIIGDLVIPDRVTDIGIGAFKNCRFIESVVIGDGITVIKEETFSGDDNIKWILITSNIAEIGQNAFSDCTELESIYYYGVKEDYAALKIGKGNLDFNYAARYYYSATKPATPVASWYYDENGNVALW